MTTTVANIRHGWPKNGFYIGRPGHGFDGFYGNPFVIGRNGDRAQVMGLYRNWFDREVERNATFRARLEELRDKTLMCFCKPERCHGDVIAEYLNATV